MLDFSGLANKYPTIFVVVEETEGHYDQEHGGKWVPGTTQEISVTGTVLPLSSKDLRYDDSGTYTVSDRKIYTYTKLKLGQKAVINGLEYTIQEEKDYSPQAGLYIYFAKRAGDVDD